MSCIQPIKMIIVLIFGFDYFLEIEMDVFESVQ